MYATVASPSCSSGPSPAAVREAVTVRQGQRAEGQGQRGTSGHGGGRLSPRALLVVFSRRRTHHDYADDLGKIAGRHLDGV